MTHLASVLVLLLKIHTIKSCAGTLIILYSLSLSVLISYLGNITIVFIRLVFSLYCNVNIVEPCW